MFLLSQHKSWTIRFGFCVVVHVAKIHVSGGFWDTSVIRSKCFSLFLSGKKSSIPSFLFDWHPYLYSFIQAFIPFNKNELGSIMQKAVCEVLW